MKPLLGGLSAPVNYDRKTFFWINFLKFHSILFFNEAVPIKLLLAVFSSIIFFRIQVFDLLKEIKEP